MFLCVDHHISSLLLHEGAGVKSSGVRESHSTVVGGHRLQTHRRTNAIHHKPRSVVQTRTGKTGHKCKKPPDLPELHSAHAIYTVCISGPLHLGLFYSSSASLHACQVLDYILLRSLLKVFS